MCAARSSQGNDLMMMFITMISKPRTTAMVQCRVLCTRTFPSARAPALMLLVLCMRWNSELPGIYDVNLVSHTMGDGISSVASSRGVSKPEKPTQGAPARAECPAPRRNPHPTARTARKTHRSFNDGRVPYD